MVEGRALKNGISGHRKYETELEKQGGKTIKKERDGVEINKTKEYLK